MNRLERAVWTGAIAGLLMIPVILFATAEGQPLAHTGAFGEPGCNPGAGCHRPEPLPAGSGRVQVEVGPYVPGEKQRVIITIVDTNAARWGFQLAAREERNPQRQAGTFRSVPDDFFTRVRCANGSAPPCASGLEYATHTSVGTRAGQRTGSVQFRMDWTAPLTDVGPVIFTAAAVGADNDGGTNGDRSFTTTSLSLFAPSNQPALSEGGLVSAASFRAPGGAVGFGSLVTIFGDKLAPPGYAREVTRLDLVSNRLPTELNRTSVDFILPGELRVPAHILYIGEKQINLQVPAIPGGFTGRVEVQAVFNRDQGRNEVRGNRVPVNVQPLSPALFTFPDGRSAAAVHSAVPAGAPVGAPGQFPGSRPARPGDVILLFGTGFGPTRANLQPGELAEGPDPLTGGVTVRIAGLVLSPADVLYAGAAPSFAGLQQFNIRIPNGLGTGDLPLVLSTGGLETQAGVTLHVGP